MDNSVYYTPWAACPFLHSQLQLPPAMRGCDKMNLCQSSFRMRLTMLQQFLAEAPFRSMPISFS